jgi:site-specific DNA-methyltransferase (adenine-specific)
MSENPNITLINEDANKFLTSDTKLYDFIYADCMYETENIDWIYYVLPHLKENGIFIVQTDYHTVAKYKTRLDILEGNEYFLLTFVNWLIYMNNWGGVPSNRFAQKHDDILVYCKGKDWKWYPDRIQIPKATAGTNFDKKGTGTKTPPSVFYDHVSFSTISNERVEIDGTNFPMQKPAWLMERLLLPFTDEGDEVLDVFAGTGTLGVVSKRLNRNYTGIEYIDSTFQAAKERIDAVHP